jgi:hypothetical protein
VRDGEGGEGALNGVDHGGLVLRLLVGAERLVLPHCRVEALLHCALLHMAHQANACRIHADPEQQRIEGPFHAERVATQSLHRKTLALLQSTTG